jgi:hypothetical protein
MPNPSNIFNESGSEKPKSKDLSESGCEALSSTGTLMFYMRYFMTHKFISSGLKVPSFQVSEALLLF